MPIMPPNSIVPKSRQGWKLALGVAAIYLVGATLWWGIHRQKGEFELAGLLGFVLVIIAVPLSISCRQCGARWLWIAVKTQRHNQWWYWLLAQTVCPKCGCDPGMHRKA